jgi:hypothetical protein
VLSRAVIVTEPETAVARRYEQAMPPTTSCRRTETRLEMSSAVPSGMFPSWAMSISTRWPLGAQVMLAPPAQAESRFTSARMILAPTPAPEPPGPDTITGPNPPPDPLTGKESAPVRV